MLEQFLKYSTYFNLVSASFFCEEEEWVVVKGTGLISFVYAEGEHAGKEKTAKRIIHNGTFGRNIFRNEAEVV